MEQGELFALERVGLATAPPEIPGFRLTEDYIDVQEERFLLEHVDAARWQNDFRRRIQQYGLGYAADREGKPSWVRDFPEWLLTLAGKAAQDSGFDRFPENCVINEYIPPQGIGPHRDYSDFGPTVACLSLGSDIVMEFANLERSLKYPILVRARSFWVISGPARFEWTHGIAPRLHDLIAGERRRRARRVSITFRTGAARRSTADA